MKKVIINNSYANTRCKVRFLAQPHPRPGAAAADHPPTKLALSEVSFGQRAGGAAHGRNCNAGRNAEFLGHLLKGSWMKMVVLDMFWIW